MEVGSCCRGLDFRDYSNSALGDSAISAFVPGGSLGVGFAS